MNLRRLQHFEALYRLQSFARAADELAITQSALSRSLQKLEEELGAVLFDRTTHYVRPTDAGDRLIRPVQDVLAAAGNLDSAANQLSRPGSGTVRVGAGPYPMNPLLTRTIGRFGAAHAGVRVTVTGGTADVLLQGLVDRSLDLVVCDISKFDGSAYADEVVVTALPREPLMIVTAAAHPLPEGRGRREAVEQRPWALPRPAPGSEHRFAPAIRTRIAQRSFPDYELDSTLACLEVVRQGAAITVVPRSLALAASRDGSLTCYAMAAGEQTNDGIHLLRNRSQSAAVTAFVRMLRETAQAVVTAG
ncbi:LysR family transcriptional regulator [Niveispirillum sp.]|uniref:LysR family transcriptional regulator n=1 Tax=Niveispirillum sp. TaxID=1917217 RepID=UPI001B54A46D|nr:LysR family transcriptional regulator [Niveispirillum sp.]MBP7338484.1 LysR family transcriptional regulator [Niveispirillum sp.]